jgi:hypothetical protein
MRNAKQRTAERFLYTLVPRLSGDIAMFEDECENALEGHAQRHCRPQRTAERFLYTLGRITGRTRLFYRVAQMQVKKLWKDSGDMDHSLGKREPGQHSGTSHAHVRQDPARPYTTYNNTQHKTARKVWQCRTSKERCPVLPLHVVRYSGQYCHAPQCNHFARWNSTSSHALEGNATHCPTKAKQTGAPRCDTTQYSAPLQHKATRCSTTQHDATRCDTTRHNAMRREVLLRTRCGPRQGGWHHHRTSHAVLPPSIPCKSHDMMGHRAG